MKHLLRKVIVGLLSLAIVLGALLFLPAWTFHYWQAWIFLFVFLAPEVAVVLYLVKNDPQLLERRIAGREKQKVQKIILLLIRVTFVAVIVFPAVDHRFAWSTVPLLATIFGDFLVVLGLLIIFLVFRENTFTSSAIEILPEQRVISSGPYAWVRHPMYSGALVMVSGVPLALGSWWGLLTVIPMALVIVWRLLEEEGFLAENLPGYNS